MDLLEFYSITALVHLLTVQAQVKVFHCHINLFVTFKVDKTFEHSINYCHELETLLLLCQNVLVKQKASW